MVQRGHAIARNNSAELHLIHVIEPLSFAYGGDIPMDFSGIQDEISPAGDTSSCSAFAESSGTVSTNCIRHIVLGRPEVEIHATAEEARRRPHRGWQPRSGYGLALLMGSTANGVLHGASCDVLAVRVGKHGE